MAGLFKNGVSLFWGSEFHEFITFLRHSKGKNTAWRVPGVLVLLLVPLLALHWPQCVTMSERQLPWTYWLIHLLMIYCPAPWCAWKQNRQVNRQSQRKCMWWWENGSPQEGHLRQISLASDKSSRNRKDLLRLELKVNNRNCLGKGAPGGRGRISSTPGWWNSVCKGRRGTEPGKFQNWKFSEWLVNSMQGETES